MSQALSEVREFERLADEKMKNESRPAIHLSPRVGWLNDPNGFSYYHGQYHLFYQYHPYSTCWGNIHWGHAVSDDLIQWEYKPAVMAPDENYDADGCFSGSAVELDDGRHLLMYTGIKKDPNNHDDVVFQTQCVAIGDGTDYKKYSHNPVIDIYDRPGEADPYNFRDPKIWKQEDGTYRAVIASKDLQSGSQILLYESKDALKWEFLSVLVENKGRVGDMWECPDFFPLDGKYVILANGMDMIQDGIDFHKGNNGFYMVGNYDPENMRFQEERIQTLDYGPDFYAGQTMIAPDDRRILIGWMQNPDTSSYQISAKAFYGQMSIPRELHVKNGILYQWPVRELVRYRKDAFTKCDVPIQSQEIKIDGIFGRVADLEVKIRPENDQKMFREFRIEFAKNDRYSSCFAYYPEEQKVCISRRQSGQIPSELSEREAPFQSENNELSLRLILDKNSAEVFLNDGEKVLSIIIETELSANEIAFYASGNVLMDITMYHLDIG